MWIRAGDKVTAKITFSLNDLIHVLCCINEPLKLIDTKGYFLFSEFYSLLFTHLLLYAGLCSIYFSESLTWVVYLLLRIPYGIQCSIQIFSDEWTTQVCLLSCVFLCVRVWIALFGLWPHRACERNAIYLLTEL